jgi:hypothetical protein
MNTHRSHVFILGAALTLIIIKLIRSCRCPRAGASVPSLVGGLRRSAMGEVARGEVGSEVTATLYFGSSSVAAPEVPPGSVGASRPR